jgi:hypothetical protein
MKPEPVEPLDGLIHEDSCVGDGFSKSIFKRDYLQPAAYVSEKRMSEPRVPCIVRLLKPGRSRTDHLAKTDHLANEAAMPPKQQWANPNPSPRRRLFCEIDDCNVEKDFKQDRDELDNEATMGQSESLLQRSRLLHSSEGFFAKTSCQRIDYIEPVEEHHPFERASW